VTAAAELPDLNDLLTGIQQTPPDWLLFGTAALALAIVLSAGPWHTARHVVTLVHEGGHAAVAVLSGRRLQGVRLHSDTSGLTLSSGRPTGLGMIATAAAGYPAPTIIGLAVTAGVASGHLALTLWGCLALVAALLVTIRNVFGLISVALTGLALIAVPLWTPPVFQMAFGYFLAWFLLLAAPRPVIELQVKRHRQRITSDADQLAQLTRVPGVIWVGFFLVVTVGGATAGGWALLRPSISGWPGF
jgi:hypothetical protein